MKRCGRVLDGMPGERVGGRRREREGKARDKGGGDRVGDDGSHTGAVGQAETIVRKAMNNFGIYNTYSSSLPPN